MSKNNEPDERIERLILMGLITSTDFLKKIRPIYHVKLFKSNYIRRVAKWSVEYFDKYGQAPHKNIETIYVDKLKQEKLPPEVAEIIEEHLLPNLSEEYEHTQFNVKYVLERAGEYFKVRRLEILSEEIQAYLSNGEPDEAAKLTEQYKNIEQSGTEYDVIDLSSPDLGKYIDDAFAEAQTPLITYPGALGEFVNSALVRGGFVALLAPEKRGKSFWLLDMLMRASKQGSNVVLFQAGDMTRNQQLRRVAIYKAQRSDKEKYSGMYYMPVKDCIHNQLDTCDREEREGVCGIFTDMELQKYETSTGGLRKNITREVLLEKLEEYPDHAPCHNCRDYRTNPWGTVWLKQKDRGGVLTGGQARRILTNFFVEKHRRFKLSTHANGTLTTDIMNELLDKWEKEEGFIADVIGIDYGDLVDDPKVKEERARQNKVWKDFRGMSQKRNALLITATQADAESYNQDSLTLKNFSEDKRKYAHVTAFWSLNQDAKGREKKLGLMRLGELVVRDDEFDAGRFVTVLQSLSTGRPVLTSYW